MANASLKGAEILAKALENEGVDIVFGLQGRKISIFLTCISQDFI